MSSSVNPKTFDKMIDEDIEWLKLNAPKSHLYRDHIEDCLEYMKLYYREYGVLDKTNLGEK